MKKKIFRVISAVICIVLIAPFAQSCSKKLAYEGGELERAETGSYYSISVATATGSDDDYDITYALKKGSSLPEGLELDEEGEISGTPSAKGDYTFKIVASTRGYKGEAEFSLRVISRLSYAASTLAGGVVGENYTASVATATGAAGIKYSLKTGTGTLPPGLALNAAGGITGIPGSGNYTFTIIASAEGFESAEATFTIRVSLPGIIYNSSGALAAGYVGMPYKTAGGQTVTVATAIASGALEITYALTGTDTLTPAELTLNADGTVTGTPKTTGTLNFTVRASAAGYSSATNDFEIVISKLALSYTGKALVAGKAGIAYTGATVGTASAPQGADTAAEVRYTKIDGPSWLTVGGTTGALSGTPTEEGTFTVNVRGSDANNNYLSKDAAFTIIVAPVLRYTGATLSAQVGVNYSGSSLTTATATAFGTAAQPAISYSTTAVMPSGLTFNANGQITGEPDASAAGTHRFSVTASAAGYDSLAANWTLIVSAMPLISYTSSPLINGKIGSAYTASVATATAAGNPGITYSVTDGNLPGGLSISSAGAITGTPSEAGTYEFTVTAVAVGYADGEAVFTIVVVDLGAVSYTAAPLPDGKITVAYTGTVATATAPNDPVINYTVTEGSLPGGLSISPAGAITGTPTAIGTFRFTVTAAAIDYTGASAEFTIIITNLGAITYTGRALTVGYKNQNYSASAATATGAPSITYTLQSGHSVPAGLSFSNGVISGVPTASGDFSFTVVARATNYTFASATFTIHIDDGGTIFGVEYIVPHTEGTSVTYVLEAENTNVGGKQGQGYSGPGDLVVAPRNSNGDGPLAGISNEFAICYLYAPLLSVNYFIVSDRDVDDAVLTLRLSAEYMNMIINPETFLIRADRITDTEIIEKTPYDTPAGAWGMWDDYYLNYKEPGSSDFKYEAAYTVDEWDCTYLDNDGTAQMGIQINCWQTGAEMVPPQNFLITTRLKLFRGVTCISLIVNNGTNPLSAEGNALGTMSAIAPIIDCIGITTKAQLGMYRAAECGVENGVRSDGCWIDYTRRIF